MERYTRSFLQAEDSQLFQRLCTIDAPVPQSPLWPFTGFTPVHPHSFHTRSLRSGLSISCVSDQWRREGSPPQLADSTPPLARLLLAFYSGRVHCWLIHPGAIQDPQMLISKAVLQPQPIVVPGAILPHIQNFVFAFVEHHGVPDSLFLQPL